MVLVVFAVRVIVLAGAKVVTLTKQETCFGYFDKGFAHEPPFFTALASMARATKLPLFGRDNAVSRLLGGALPTLVWMGMNPAGVGTVDVLVKVVSVLATTVETKVLVGASVVVVVRSVEMSVKVSP